MFARLLMSRVFTDNMHDQNDYQHQSFRLRAEQRIRKKNIELLTRFSIYKLVGQNDSIYLSCEDAHSISQSGSFGDVLRNGCRRYSNAVFRAIV